MVDSKQLFTVSRLLEVTPTISLLPLPNKKVNRKARFTKDHLLLCTHTPSLYDFSLLAHEGKKLIKRD